MSVCTEELLGVRCVNSPISTSVRVRVGGWFSGTPSAPHTAPPSCQGEPPPLLPRCWRHVWRQAALSVADTVHLQRRNFPGVLRLRDRAETSVIGRGQDAAVWNSVALQEDRKPEPQHATLVDRGSFWFFVFFSWHVLIYFKLLTHLSQLFVFVGNVRVFSLLLVDTYTSMLRGTQLFFR